MKNYEEALNDFRTALQGKLDTFYKDNSYNKQVVIIKGRKYDRVILVESYKDGTDKKVSRSAYCWIERSNGNILKGSWKAVTSKIPRGNIYNDDCLIGCGPYGTDYLNMTAINETVNSWRD